MIVGVTEGVTRVNWVGVRVGGRVGLGVWVAVGMGVLVDVGLGLNRLVLVKSAVGMARVGGKVGGG